MWIKVLLAFAPDIESLLNAVLGVANQSAADSQNKADELHSQAKDLLSQAANHQSKADKASTIASKLKGVIG